METNKELSYWKTRTVLEVKSGSHAYGLATEESDKDYKGIVIPPIEYYFGLQEMKTYSSSTAKQTSKNTKDDIDYTLYEIKEFARKALTGNFTYLEMLYVSKEDVTYSNEVGSLLLENREFFLTKKVNNSIKGFAVSNMKKIKNKLDKTDNYNPKDLMHILRVLDMGIEANATGVLNIKVTPDKREFLLNVKENRVFDDAKGLIIPYIEDKLERLDDAIKESILPDKADSRQIEGLVMDSIDSQLNIDSDLADLFIDY